MEEKSTIVVIEPLKAEDVILTSVRTLNSIESLTSLTSSLTTSISPNIQCESQALLVNIGPNKSSNRFSDAFGYQLKNKLGLNELELISQIDHLIERGQYFIHTLYSSRCISKAIPEKDDLITSIRENLPFVNVMSETDIEEQIEIKKSALAFECLKILRISMQQIIDVIHFIDESLQTFTDTIALISSLTDIVPEILYGSMISLLDILFKLDSLRDLKTSSRTDFAKYKQLLGTNISQSDGDELKQLQKFFDNQKYNTQYCIRSLKDKLKKIRGNESILVEILQFAINSIEKKQFVIPDEKFKLLRVLPHFLLLIDGSDHEGKEINVFSTKLIDRLKIQNMQVLLKELPVVPLYCDISVTLSDVLETLEGHYNASMGNSWGADPDNKIIEKYNIVTHWPTIRSTYSKYLTRFTAAINKLEKYPFRKMFDEVNIELAKDSYNMCLDGFKLLSEWSAIAHESMAWKYTHPCDVDDIEDQDKAAEAEDKNYLNYAQAFKYNISKEELSVLVDVLSMIKSLAALMNKSENILAPLLRFHMHHRIQQFIQGDLLPILHRLDKRGKSSLPSLLALRSVSADWNHGLEPVDNFKDYSRKQGRVSAKHPARVVSASMTQLHLLRSHIKTLNHETSELRQRNGMMGKIDLEKEDVAAFDDFYYDTFYYSYMLNYVETIRDLSDLGDLWFRELHLETASAIQFPIETSIPWILSEHIISATSDSSNVPLVENIFFILNIYNDAAFRALHVFKQQYLYDEIEAEANLALDQLVFLISDDFYRHYKNISASICLEKSFKHVLEEVKSASHFQIRPKRYDSVVSQKSIQLLGRSINFSFLIKQHVNTLMSRDIEIAIKRFESSDITGIVELQSLLSILQKTHSLVSTLLPLDPFNTLLNEATENLAPTCIRHRINEHIISCLVTDLFPNFCYNSYTNRFVRSPVTMNAIEPIKPIKNSVLSETYGPLCFKAFELTGKLTRGFFGKPHMEAYVALMQYQDFSIIIDSCFAELSEKLSDVAAYAEALKEYIPSVTPPKYMFHSPGCYSYYLGKLKPILNFDDLKTCVYQKFRIIGNIIAFVKDLSDLLDVNDHFRYMNIAPLFGIKPSSTTFNVKTCPIIVDMEKVVSLAAQTADQDDHSDMLVQQLPELEKTLVNHIQVVAGSKSLFVCLLDKINETLQYYNLSDDYNIVAKQPGHAPGPFAGIEVVKAGSFHRLWSTLTFLFNMQEQDQSAAAVVSMRSLNEDVNIGDENSNLPDLDVFGHGFAISGTLLLHLLGQRSIFELLDFSYYVLKIDSHDHLVYNEPDSISLGRPSDELKLETKNFMTYANSLKVIQTSFLHLYETQYPVAKNKTSSIKFSPPSTV